MRMPLKYCIAITAIFLGTVACNGDNQNQVAGDQAPGDTVLVPVSGLPPDSIFPGLHGFAPDFLTVCQNLGWTASCTDPVFTDDQRLRLGPSEYGAHGYIAPSPSLKSWHLTSDFATPKLAGIVWFKAGDAGGTGWLPPGLTCLYLQFTAGNFTAFAAPGSVCPATPPAGAQELNVFAMPNPGQFGTGTEVEQSGNVPGVARFHEALAAGNDAPILGLKCASRWCFLSSKQLTANERQPAHAGQNMQFRTWAVRGWSDAQRLATGTSPNLTPTTLSASVIADTGLAGKTWTVQNADSYIPHVEQHAATIVLAGRPIDNYTNKWHFQQGRNELFLWKDAAGKWYGEVQNVVGNTLYRIPVYVLKRHAGTNPAQTARWRWNADDEEIWVACDGGCCYVSAFR